MPPYTHIVWDFNGTLLNDLDAALLSANALLSNHGLPPMRDLAEYRSYFGFPIIEYYRRLGFDFEKTPYSTLAVEWIELYTRFSKDAAVFDAVPAILSLLRDNGACQLVLSATQLDMLRAQIRALGIAAYFDQLLGLDNIHAYSKTELAASWRRDNPNATVLLIGDTEHDLETANAMRADCILLSCGHRPASALKLCDALAVLPDHNALLSYLSRLYIPAEIDKSDRHL